MINFPDVSESEFKSAELLFAKNPMVNKLRYQDEGDLEHSFIRGSKSIWALHKENSNALGTGTFARVKRCVNDEGKVLAVKIIGLNRNDRYGLECLINEINALDVLDLLKDKAKRRTFEQQRSYLTPENLIHKKYYLMMDLWEGSDLFDELHISKKKPVLMERVSLAVKLCDALAKVHAHRIIHGDLKPENVMLLKDGHVQIVDFGVCKFLPQDCSKIYSDFVGGTPLYADPHLLKTHEFSFASDIYSLGIMFQSDFKLSNVLIDKMISTDVNARPSLQEIRKSLSDYLEVLQTERHKDKGVSQLESMAQPDKNFNNNTNNLISDKKDERIVGQERQPKGLLYGFENLCILAQNRVNKKDKKNSKKNYP